MSQQGNHFVTHKSSPMKILKRGSFHTFTGARWKLWHASNHSPEKKLLAVATLTVNLDYRSTHILELLPPLVFPGSETRGGNNSRSIGRKPKNLGVLACFLVKNLLKMRFPREKIGFRDAIFKNFRLRRCLSIQMRFSRPDAGGTFRGSEGFELLPPPLFFPDLKQGGG